ncbi:MAG: decaprenyl-phosphate phosphoribosyltransferase [Gemmatimonadetes bacterium]|nr:decaprenyl-phosphate phosphoribosyltransferase [Gemmatimonadota bacterium]
MSLLASEALPSRLPGALEDSFISAPIRRPLLQLLRPRQWIKNIFVLAPVIFAGLFFDGEAVGRALLAGAIFSMAASAVYLLNDLLDAERDRQHPTKRFTRPIAAGVVSTRQAVTLLGALCLILLLALTWWPVVGLVVALYLAINVAYSFKLKHVPVVDLFCIATGFVLRVWVGALAVEVPLSSWMLITTLCLALYLAAIKRRTELTRSGRGGRAVLGAYSVVLLDRYAEIAAVSSILFYGLYVMEVRPELTVTIPLVLFGLFRYWFIVEKQDAGESPTDALYSDLPLLLTVAAWGVLSGTVLWISQP